MSNEKTSKIINFKCTTQDLELIKKLAEESDRSMSGFISFIVKDYIKNYQLKKLETHFDNQ